MRNEPHKFFCSDHHCTDNCDILNRAVAGTGFCFTDLVNDIHTLHYVPKDRVFGIEEVVVDKVDEELAAPGVGARVCHGNCTPVIPVVFRELIFYLVTWVTHTGSSWITALNHKAVYDPVEDYPIVKTFFYERFEISCGYGHSRIESNGDITHVRLEPDQFLFLC